MEFSLFIYSKHFQIIILKNNEDWKNELIFFNVKKNDNLMRWYQLFC